MVHAVLIEQTPAFDDMKSTPAKAWYLLYQALVAEEQRVELPVLAELERVYERQAPHR